MENGHGLIGAKIRANITAEEPPDLPLTAELGSEGAGVDLYHFCGLAVNLLIE